MESKLNGMRGHVSILIIDFKKLVMMIDKSEKDVVFFRQRETKIVEKGSLITHRSPKIDPLFLII